MSIRCYEFNVGLSDNGVSVRSFLRRQCGLSARSMTVIKYSGGSITCRRQALRANDVLHVGDIVEVCLPQEHNEIAPVSGSLSILFEDDHLLAVNKPAGMPVHPTKVHQLDTLANIVTDHQRSRGEDYTFRVLNRLDKDTSGCVLIAKDRIAYNKVQPTVQKSYIAVCEGIVKSEGTVHAPIALSERSKIKRCVSMNGQDAVTHYLLLRSSNDHSLCKLWLETGRTHQIRCHMSSIGHPLAGDDMYGGSLEHIGRQALHCQSMTFTHPVSGECVSLSTDIPSEFLSILDDSI